MTDTDHSDDYPVCAECGRRVELAHPAMMGGYRCPVHGELAEDDWLPRRGYDRRQNEQQERNS